MNAHEQIVDGVIYFDDGGAYERELREQLIADGVIVPLDRTGDPLTRGRRYLPLDDAGRVAAACAPRRKKA